MSSSPEQTLDFMVYGKRINYISKEKEKAFIPIGTQRLFKISSNEEEEEEDETHESDNEDVVKEEKVRPRVRKLTRKEKKEIALKEILALQNIQKKHQEVHRHLLPVSSQTYPSFIILKDICKTQNKSIEEVKKYMLSKSRRESKKGNIDFTDLDSYLSKAYFELYEENLSNVKEIIYRLHSSPKKRTEKILKVPTEEYNRVGSAPN